MMTKQMTMLTRYATTGILSLALLNFPAVAQDYMDCGYRISELPKVSPSARADFVIGQI